MTRGLVRCAAASSSRKRRRNDLRNLASHQSASRATPPRSSPAQAPVRRTEGRNGACPRRSPPARRVCTFAASGHVRKHLCVLGGIHRHERIGATRQGDQGTLFIFNGPTTSFAIKIFRDARVCRHFRFTELRARDADGAGLYLQLGDGSALMAFEMGAQFGVTLGEVRTHEIEVRLQSIRIQQQCGRVSTSSVNVEVHVWFMGRLQAHTNFL